MKRKLLKPPSQDGEVLFLPEPEYLISRLTEQTRIGVCHQPYFFNPGVSLKFLVLESLPRAQKEIIFLDTDQVNIHAKIPTSEGYSKMMRFIVNDRVLMDYSIPKEDTYQIFFNRVQDEMEKNIPFNKREILSPFQDFKEIFLKKGKRRFLKEVLAESFLAFYGIKRDYQFLSDLIIKDKNYTEFFLKIYKDQHAFREMFNTAIDEFRNIFRFRYKNYPFQKLEDDELPFWIIREGKRARCFKKDIKNMDFKKLTILPRAVTLTIFLRLYRLDIFIHGIGGGNYEWIQDRMIERFHKQTPPEYAVISGTFLLKGSQERDLSYFLFSPERIKCCASSFLFQ
ncbi:MAG: hypothetical protein ACMUIM_07685 [bacterium]